MRSTQTIICCMASIIVSLLLISCIGTGEMEYPVFTLDDKYNQIQKDDSPLTPENYKLSSLNGFILDCSNYDFSLIKTMNDDKLPDVAFILSKGGLFAIELNPNEQTTFDSTTMQSIDQENKAFSGFIRGDTVILAIGTIKNDEMKTYWLANINVQ